MHVNYSPAWLTVYPSIWIPETKVKLQSRSVKFMNIHTHPASDLEKHCWKHLRAHHTEGRTNGSPPYHHCRCSRGPGWRCLLRCCAESPQGCWAVSVAPHSHWNDLQEELWNNHCDHRKMPGEERKTKTLTPCSLHNTKVHYQPAVRAAQKFRLCNSDFPYLLKL